MSAQLSAEQRRGLEQLVASNGRPAAQGDGTAPGAEVTRTPPGDAGDGRDGGSHTDSNKASQATTLATLAGDAAEFFHHEDEAFAAVGAAGHRETWPLRSKHFRSWMSRLYFEAEHRVPGAQAVQDALAVLEGQALFAGEEHTVGVRLAGDDSRFYLDLGGDDWQAVEVDAAGWRLAEPRARMRRPKGLTPLPAPMRGGSVEELRRFVNVERESDWMLLVAWLLGALRPHGPYPVLVLHGEHGTAKSTTARLLRSLIDPSRAPLRADPREPRDLMISATNGWIVAYDNLSALRPWLSDALCRLSTGGGFATRALYSDSEECIFEAQRPVILTGIEELATRGDLLDRSILLYLPRIDKAERRPERELWADFEAARPRILGALLDAAATAVRRLPETALDEVPRMADFALWTEAAQLKLGWPAGAFLRAYEGNRNAASELTLEASPVAPHLRELADQGGFEGTAGELLERIGTLAGESVARRAEWPKTARALSGELRRIAPNLRELGLEVTFPGRTGRRRLLRIAPQNTVTTVTTVTDAASDDANDGDDGGLRTHSSAGDQGALS